MRNRTASFAARQDILAAGELKTLKDLLVTASQFHLGKTAFREMVGPAPVDYSYDQLLHDVRALGTALFDMGMEGRHIAILGENSFRWVVSHLAITSLGVSVPLDKELTPCDLTRLVELSESEMLFTSEKYLKTAMAIQAELPALKQIVLWTSCDCIPDGVLSMDSLLAKGDELLAKRNRAFLNREPQPDDLAAIQFTSGTTGANKGVQLTHRNICATLNSIANIVPIEMVSFSVLPMNHTFETNCHILPGIYLGATICFNSSLKRMMRNLQIFKPGMSVVVPLFIDEIYSSIWINAKRQGKEKELKKALVLSKALRAIGVDARETLFRDVHESFGGNLNLFVCGGAPLNSRSAKGLEDMGFDIINGYGITECAPLVAINLFGGSNIEAVGAAVPSVEIRLTNNCINGVGEILVRGDNVTAGYYKDDEANAASFEDGWFRTGDYGYIDRKKRLWIAGRKKNIIVLDNGKNVFPEEIEAFVLKNIPYVKDIIVHEASFYICGNLRRQIAATFTLKDEFELSALDCDSRKEQIAADFRKLNHSLASYKQISAVRISEKGFTKNAAKKIIRSSIAKKGDYIFL